MEFNDPYNELYEGIFNKLVQAEYETYDHLPGDSASYPFIFLGEQFSEDQQTKTRTLGSTNLIVHVYDHDDKRRQLNKMIANIRKIIHEMDKTEHFSWGVTSSSTQVIYENTTNFGNKLAHGVLDVTLKFE